MMNGARFRRRVKAEPVDVSFNKPLSTGGSSYKREKNQSQKEQLGSEINIAEPALLVDTATSRVGKKDKPETLSRKTLVRQTTDGLGSPLKNDCYSCTVVLKRLDMAQVQDLGNDPAKKKLEERSEPPPPSTVGVEQQTLLEDWQIEKSLKFEVDADEDWSADFKGFKESVGPAVKTEADSESGDMAADVATKVEATLEEDPMEEEFKGFKEEPEEAFEVSEEGVKVEEEVVEEKRTIKDLGCEFSIGDEVVDDEGFAGFKEEEPDCKTEPSDQFGDPLSDERGTSPAQTSKPIASTSGTGRQTPSTSRKRNSPRRKAAGQDKAEGATSPKRPRRTRSAAANHRLHKVHHLEQRLCALMIELSEEEILGRCTSREPASDQLMQLFHGIVQNRHNSLLEQFPEFRDTDEEDT